MQQQDRVRIINEKKESIRTMLMNWVQRDGILNPGERIVFTMTIEEVPTVVERTQEKVLAMSISDLNLSVRARKGCRRAITGSPQGEAILGDLIKLSADDLLDRSRNFGMTSLNEVREKLRRLGLALQRDEI